MHIEVSKGPILGHNRDNLSQSEMPTPAHQGPDPMPSQWLDCPFPTQDFCSFQLVGALHGYNGFMPAPM